MLGVMLRETDQVIAVYRDQYVRGVIEVDDFERAVERALVDEETYQFDGRPDESEWVRLAVEAHRRSMTTT